MSMDKEQKIEQEMRVLAQKIKEEEEREEDEKGATKPNGKWEKGKLPISPTRMSTHQAKVAQESFTKIVAEVDDELMSEGWAVKDGRGKRVAGRSFVMSCLTDLMVAASEPMGDNPSEFRKEIEHWKEIGMKYVKERRRTRDFYPKK